MDRYIAMLWEPAVLSRRWQAERWCAALMQRSPHWTTVLDAPGVKVVSLAQRTKTPRIAAMPDASGVVIGPLFRRGEEKQGRIAALDPSEAERVVATQGEHLTKACWGRYVAFWRDEARQSTHVLRDPCGGTPCFMAKVEGVDLLFSHAEDVAALHNVRFTPDWTYLQAFVLFNYFVTQHTGLNEVTELLPGQRLDWRTNQPHAFGWVWRGDHCAAEAQDQPFTEAADELRATAEACFTAIGRDYKRSVVSVSGGFDSAVMTSLLRRVAGADVVALHYLGVGYERYEARLARRAAENAGVDFFEVELDPQKDDVRNILKAPRLARPQVQSIANRIDEVSTDLADRIGADAFMIGQGGDNLFLQRGGARRIFADYLRMRGLDAGALGVAYDAAMLEQQPVAAVLGGAIAALTRPSRPYAFLDVSDWAERRLITPDAARAIPREYKVHPWLDGAARLPPSKADHLLGVVSLYRYYLNLGRGVERDICYPLFSQPITEFALRTPTYLLCHGGLDRALARRAFGDLVPSEINRRTGKGAADAYQLQVTQANLGFFRELVLDGVLIRQDWLDRAKVEHMLTPAFITHGAGAMFLYLLVAAEAWLHTWTRSSARAAA